MITNIKLTDHFTLDEAIRSDTAVKNHILNYPDTDSDTATIARTAMKMEEVRAQLSGNPIIISSWYRNAQLNKLVGGVPSSQHQLGEAVDFTCPKFGSHVAVANYLRSCMVPLGIDQLILEPTWVHVSFKTARPSTGSRVPRNQFLDLRTNSSTASE